MVWSQRERQVKRFFKISVANLLLTPHTEEKKSICRDATMDQLTPFAPGLEACAVVLRRPFGPDQPGRTKQVL
jgi:hypothetical protein